jgi:hypothetical protein
MLKKIHSNRNPGDTLQSEISNQFGGYFAAAGKSFGRCLMAYPRFWYGVMMTLLMISLVLSFTVLRHPDKRPLARQHTNPAIDGFSQIMEASGKLRQTLLLKQLIDSITLKKYLTARDSAVLDSALDHLQQMSKPLK